MSRMPIRNQKKPFVKEPCDSRTIWGISGNFSPLYPCCGQVAYALRTRAPVAGSALLRPAAPRLACVKPAASVHPEPGSNSSLYELLFLYLNSFGVLPPAAPAGCPTHAVSRSQNFNVLAPVSAPPRREPFFRRKRVQRYDHFSIRQTFFSLFFKVFSVRAVGQRVADEDFFPLRRGRGRKTGFPGLSSAVFRGSEGVVFRCFCA